MTRKLYLTQHQLHKIILNSFIPSSDKNMVLTEQNLCMNTPIMLLPIKQYKYGTMYV